MVRHFSEFVATQKGRTILLLAGIAVTLSLPLVLSTAFSLHILIMLCVYATLASAWNVLGGYAGQVSLGHTVFFGIGAYSSTLLTIRLGWSPWLGMLVGVALAVIAALAIGVPTFRLSGKYFVIATIAVLQIGQTMVTGTPFLGGAAGLSVPIKAESFWSMQFHSSKIPYAYIAIGILACAILLVRHLNKSRAGYYFRVIRENEDVAESLGINTIAYKLYAIMLSAALTAVAGTFYAQYIMFIDPTSVISYAMATKMCLVTVLGGAGTVLGPVVGAIILIPLSEISRAYLGGSGGGVDLIVYGVLIMLITIYRPDGIAGILASRRSRPVATKGGAGVGKDA